MEQNGPEQIECEEKDKKKVLMLGLSSSGKSSILQAIQMNHMKVADGEMAPEPTEGFHVICLQTGTVELNIWEIGGSEKMRKYWMDFVQDCDILVYVVDAASDEESLKLAGEELQRVLDNSHLNDIPLILLANKQDVDGARTPHQVLEALHLRTETLENRKLHEIGTAVKRDTEASGLGSLETILTQL